MPLYTSKKTGHRIPSVPFLRVAEGILGKNYELSVTFVSPAHMKTLNKKFRDKNSSTDILSFDYGPHSGELFISMPDVGKKARIFDMGLRDYFGYLVIHGMLHLQGFDHGKKMELSEKKFAKRYGFKTPKN